MDRLCTINHVTDFFLASAGSHHVAYLVPLVDRLYTIMYHHVTVVHYCRLYHCCCCSHPYYFSLYTFLLSLIYLYCCLCPFCYQLYSWHRCLQVLYFFFLFITYYATFGNHTGQKTLSLLVLSLRAAYYTWCCWATP